MKVDLYKPTKLQNTHKGVKEPKKLEKRNVDCN